ncbi:hypothetical protein K7957_12125 [Sphingomonas yunnanensis]|nr:hypothetical protein [Sphingomonas yunnanensis]
MEPISQDQVLVTVALALVALLAVLTVIGMVWGARLKAKRRAAEAEEQQRIEELRADGVEVTNTADGVPPIMRGDDRASEERRHPVPEQETQPAARPSPIHDERPADEAPPEPPLAGEPIVAAAPLDASPASAAADTPRVAADETPGAQSITLLKGLGPKIATRLGELGVTRVDQIAWLDDAEAAQLDSQLGVFTGRMERDRWREQARLLAQGDRAGYEAQFGKLG